MEYKYEINDISEKVKISKPSLYALIKKNKPFINENSVRRQRKIYYNQKVMDFFVSYYLPEQVPEEGKNPDESLMFRKAEGKGKSVSDSPYKEEEQKAHINTLQAEIDALQAEIEVLRKQLDDKEDERKELLRQNGALILTISQLQQEKQLLLPAPKKSFSDKVKTFLKNRSHQE